MRFLQIAKLVGILFTGGLLTSIAEYYIHYSLYDTIKDKLLSLFHKKQAS